MKTFDRNHTSKSFESGRLQNPAHPVDIDTSMISGSQTAGNTIKRLYLYKRSRNLFSGAISAIRYNQSSLLNTDSIGLQYIRGWGSISVGTFRDYI
jgi:hypothetical protein